MVQVIQGKKNIFGRIGQGLGQGLAEQIPKEVDRYRLSEGLKQFEQDSANLNPMQQLARLSSIPGITPQMIQSFGELGKHQSIRNTYGKGVQGREEVVPSSTQAPGTRMQDVEFAATKGKSPSQKQPSVMRPEEMGQTQINPENPTRDQALPAKPWSQTDYDKEVTNQLRLDPYATIDQAFERASKVEARELALPEAERNRDEYRRTTQGRVYDKFDKQLADKLQKAGSDTYADTTGEMQQKLKRSMDREIALKNDSEDDVINKYTEKALDLAKIKKQVTKGATVDYGDIAIPKKRDERVKQLKSAQKTFADSNNQEEYFNLLKSQYGTSPQGAASISNPLNKELTNYVSKVKASPARLGFEPNAGADKARKHAIEIEPMLKDPSQSILSIIYNLREKDPYFDQRAFLDQLREDQDDLGLSPQQVRELGPGGGVSDYFPNWGDLFLLPIF